MFKKGIQIYNWTCHVICYHDLQNICHNIFFKSIKGLRLLKCKVKYKLPAKSGVINKILNCQSNFEISCFFTLQAEKKEHTCSSYQHIFMGNLLCVSHCDRHAGFFSYWQINFIQGLDFLWLLVVLWNSVLKMILEA